LRLGRKVRRRLRGGSEAGTETLEGGGNGHFRNGLEKKLREKGLFQKKDKFHADRLARKMRLKKVGPSTRLFAT